MSTKYENKTEILGYEPYFKKNVAVATINHETKTIKPTHGYFYPHSQGKRCKKIAKEIGYTFNNN